MPPRKRPSEQIGKTRKEIIRQRWGWARRIFTANQQAAGQTWSEANKLWFRKRKNLRASRIDWPLGQHLGPFELTDFEKLILKDDPYISREEWEADWELNSDDEGRELEYHPFQTAEERYADWDPTDEDLVGVDRQIADALSLPDVDEDTIEAASQIVNTPPKHRQDQLIKAHKTSHEEDVLANLRAETALQRQRVKDNLNKHYQKASADYIKGAGKHTAEKHKILAEDTEDDDEPPAKIIGDDVPETDLEDSQPASDMSQQAGPSNADGSPGSQMSAESGGLGPGQADTMGTTGGGLAGAGNNTWFTGFARSTVPRCPPDYSYVDTYRRPFAIHTEFPQPTQNQGIIDLTPYYTNDRNTAGPLGFPVEYAKLIFDHGGVNVPYDFMEASMKDCDWNKDNNHESWELLEFGFTIPNLRLSIMNNNKIDALAVAPAPPADARMWMFIDDENNYGNIHSYDLDDVTHSHYFTEEDIINPGITRYELPRVGARTLFVEPNIAAQIVGADATWDKVATAYSNDDANKIYDLKRHPSYREFVLSKGGAMMSYSYKVNTPRVRLLHPPMTSLDFNYRESSNSYTWSSAQADAEPWCHQWSVVTAPYLENRDATGDDNPADMLDGMAQFYCANLAAYTKQLGDTAGAQAAGTQISYDQVGSNPVRPPGNAAIATNAVNGVLRTTGRHNVDDNGSYHSPHISKRPPIFMFGVHKELEDRGDTPLFWRYYCYGQVEYYCKIKWNVKPCRFKAYLPIGLGGVYTNSSNPVDHGRKQQLEARRKYRQSHIMVGNSTMFESAQDKKTAYI